jgi:hypothetical protein
MTPDAEELDLKSRLSLIESMIAEGRRTTESWGWTFVFWGLAYYIAIAWTAVYHWPWAWLVTMASAWVVCVVIIQIKKKNQSARRPGTTIGRAIFAVWISMGVSLSLLLPALGFSDRFDQHIFVAIVAAMLGVANGASGIIIRWKAQIAAAVVWWVASVAACLGSDQQCSIVFLVAIFLCQIVFGGYAMLMETRVRKLEGAVHA